MSLSEQRRKRVFLAARRDHHERLARSVDHLVVNAPMKPEDSDGALDSDPSQAVFYHEGGCDGDD